jgi:hypothetical protein
LRREWEREEKERVGGLDGEINSRRGRERKKKERSCNASTWFSYYTIKHPPHKQLNKLTITYSTSYHWKVLCDNSDKAGSRWGFVWRGVIMRNTAVEIIQPD